jgi:hypothetical protein
LSPLHPTNRNASKSLVRILTIILSPLRIHVWSYHQKLDRLQSKIISLSRVMSPETHALSACLQRFRPPEIFGCVLNLPIVAFQTGLIEFLSKVGLAKVKACSFGFVGCRGYLSGIVCKPLA